MLPFRHLVTLSMILFLPACGGASLTERAREVGATEISLQTRLFDLAGAVRCPANSGEPLVIYIEGDGRAWKSRTIPSDDPTPSDPVAFDLMAKDLQHCTVYMARPCQFRNGKGRNCRSDYWTSGRFAPEVIQAYDEAVSDMKRRTGRTMVSLVGFSGGGAIAVLLAARRTDVGHLMTVAGVLDHEAWTAHHGVSPLTGSLNPREVAPKLGHLPQVHLQGESDRQVPPATTSAFFAALPPATPVERRVVPGAGHHSF